MIAWLAIVILSILLIVLCVALVRYETESQTHEDEILKAYKDGLARGSEMAEAIDTAKELSTPTKREAA